MRGAKVGRVIADGTWFRSRPGPDLDDDQKLRAGKKLCPNCEATLIPLNRSSCRRCEPARKYRHRP